MEETRCEDMRMK